MKLKHLISTSALIFAGIPTANAQSSFLMCESCPAGTYSNGGSITSCTPCPAGQYQSATGATSCGYCSTGYYSTGGAKSCTACTNKPANSYYTGSSTSNSCPWACNSGYDRIGDVCYKTCTTGQYRSGTSCASCTNGPANSYYTSSATSNSCPWECNSGFIKSGNSCVVSNPQHLLIITYYERYNCGGSDGSIFCCSKTLRTSGMSITKEGSFSFKGCVTNIEEKTSIYTCKKTNEASATSTITCTK